MEVGDRIIAQRSEFKLKQISNMKNFNPYFHQYIAFPMHFQVVSHCSESGMLAVTPLYR
jgi:hypothetical protein